MTAGWIKLHRQIWENPLFHRPAYLAVWLWLLSHAEHGMREKNGKWVRATQEELRQVLFAGERIRLQAGQQTAGAYQIAAGCGVPRGTVERILKVLKSEEQIEVRSDRQCSLITVKNWSQYQMSEERNEERVRNDRGTSEDYKENGKNEKNDKKATVNFSQRTKDEIRQWSHDDLLKAEVEFKRSAAAFHDTPYIEKTWDQLSRLPHENKVECLKKCVLFSTYARIRSDEKQGKARTLLGEIAGYVNDFGDMERLRGETKTGVDL